MEFIIWDKEAKEFIYPCLYWFEENLISDIEDLEHSEYELFMYICKTDINNKKIYADCSVVEFYEINKAIGVHKKHGFFKYDKERLRYMVYLLEDDIFIPYDEQRVHKMKIIGTLQENNYAN